MIKNEKKGAYMIKFLIGMFLGLCIGGVAGFMMCALCSISKNEGDDFIE